MSVHDPPSPDWRSAEAYRPLLGAEAAVWAWEFGRRAADGPNGRDPGADLRSVGDLCFAGAGPRGDPLPAVLWTWRADPSVPVLNVEPVARRDGVALDLRTLRLAVMVVRTADDEQHVLISDGARRLRLAIVRGDVLSGPVACRFQLPSRTMGATSLDGLRRLLALRDTGRLPSAGVRRSAKPACWAEMLRAMVFGAYQYDRPPIAAPDSAATTVNTPTVIDVRANDGDPDGDVVTINAVTSPSHGAVTIAAGQITYTPANGYVDVDTFTYTLSDGRGQNASTSVGLTVVAANQSPLAVNDTVSAAFNSAKQVAVLANDSDAGGDTLTITTVSQPAHGAAAITGGQITYTPNSWYEGTDSFTYTISDGKYGVASATVTP